MGKKNNFHQIKDQHQFTSVPFANFGDLRNFIQQIEQGEGNILYADSTNFLAKLCSDQSKLIKTIPISTNGFADLVQGIHLALGGLFQRVPALQSYFISHKAFILNLHSPKNPNQKIQSGAFVDFPVRPLLPKLLEKSGFLVNYFTESISTIPTRSLDEIENYYIRIYVNLIFALLERDLPVIIAPFSVALVQFFHMMQVYSRDIVSDIQTGTFTSDSIRKMITPETIEKLSNLMQTTYSPEYRALRAEELELQFASGFYSIATRLWPKLQGVGLIVGGAYLDQLPTLESFIGKIPILGSSLIYPEGCFGFNLVGRNYDEYVLHPRYAYYEFIPEDLLSEAHPESCLPHVPEVGKRYELVITNKSGLYRYRLGDVFEIVGFLNAGSFDASSAGQWPIIKFSYRLNCLLDVVGEKVNSSMLLHTIKNLEFSWKAKIVDFTILLHSHLSPPSYEFFIELEGSAAGIDSSQLDQMMRLHHASYDKCRANNSLSCSRVSFVAPGTFEKFLDKIVAEGADPAQAAVPFLLNSHIKFFSRSKIA